jgi:uncharacterized protein
MDLTGKNAVVTGASAGIGVQIARDLARAGARVVLLARRRERLEALAQELGAEGGQAHAYVLDVGDRAAYEHVAGQILEAFGAVDILINNAGFGRRRTLLDEPVEEIERVTAVNYLGTVYGIKLFLPGMVERGSGHIINIASVAGEVSSPAFGPYNASKAAVIALSEAVAAELSGSGVYISVVNPGPVETEFHEHPSFAQAKTPPRLLYSTVEDCSRVVFRALEKKGVIYHVPGWLGAVAWGLRATGPLGRAFVGAVRRVKNR